MKLGNIIDDLHTIDDRLTIYAQKSPEWTKISEAELLPPNKAASECRYPYFLEVFVARNVLQAWSFARANRVPNAEERYEALIYFAENDAYLLP